MPLIPSAARAQDSDGVIAQRRRPLLLVALIAGAAAVNIALLIEPPPNGYMTRHVLGSLLLWLNLVPTLVHFARDERRIPFMPLLALVYFIAYGGPAFSGRLELRGVLLDESFVEMALWLTLGGEVAMLLAFYALASARLPRLRLPLDLKSAPNRLVLAAGLLLGLRVLLASQSSAMLFHYLAQLPAILVSGLWILSIRGQLSLAQRVAMWVILAGILAIDFSSGFLAQPMLTLVTIFFAEVAERGRLPLFALAVVALVILPGQGAKAQFRTEMSQRPDLSILDRVARFGELSLGIYTGGARAIEKTRKTSSSRTDHLSALAWVVRSTPAFVPYWEGATYADFFWSFAPRALFPDKPTKTLGQVYGHRYRRLDPTDRLTSINFEQLVELYANFGTIGVLIGMALIGALYRVFFELFSHPGAGDGGILLAAGALRGLLNIESDFSLVFGGVLPFALIVGLVLWLIAGRRPDAPAGAARSA